MTVNTMNEIQVEQALVKEQMELEMGMKDAGVVRFRKMIENMRRTKSEDSTSYGDRIIGGYIEPVATTIDQWVEEGRGKAGARRLAQPYIEALDSKVVAMLGLKVLTSQLMSDQARLGRAAIGIARMMEDELRCQHLRAQDKKAYNGIMKAAAKKGEYKRKVDVVRFLTKQDGGEWTRWDDKVCMHIGMVVINCIQKSVQLVEFYDFYDGKKTICCMRPTGDTKDWVKRNLDFMKFCCPVLEPTIIPPKPWIAGELKGGYWTDHIPRRPLVKARNKNYLEELKYADMPKVLAAVNAAQNTAWRINKDVLDLINVLVQRDSELGGVPRASLYELPIKPTTIDHDEEARKKYRAEARAVHEANVNLTSKRLSFLQVLETAKKYSKYPAIYMPAQLDFRGRVYFMPQLNPQGPDWVKGLLEFSEGHPLGEHGLEWLQIHIANLFGVDKVTYSERVKWVEDNTEMLIAIAERPYENREWCDADKPFQAYAACREYRNALLCDDPTTFVSRIPIALDGSCSGIQNLSLAFRDEIGGAAVNIVPSERPSDIYQLVADKAIEQLEKLAAQNEPVAQNAHEEDEVSEATMAQKEKARQRFVADNPDHWLAKKMTAQNERDAQNGQEQDEVSDAELARWWLDFGITRKVTKRNCMTFPYGSKQRGFSDQILEDTLNPHIKEHGELPYNPMKLSNLLAKVNYAAVQQTVLKAAEAMDWMQNAARMVAKEGRPVCWTTPLGLPVVQNYLQTKQARVETSLAGERKVLSIREETLKPDTRKAANSISPNVVHSLDASHLMLTVANATEQGIDAFALIHDSFGTHAGKTELFYDIIRSSMIELYSGDVFGKLRDEFLAQVHPDKHEEFPELPAKGQLKPEVVMESLYAFA